MKKQKFGNYLKAGMAVISHIENKAQFAVEDEFGELLGVSRHTIARYKSGNIPPSYQHIEILAKTIVERAKLNSSWINEFLRQAEHPYPSKILQELFPESGATSNYIPKKSHNNVPAPTYGEFVKREAYNELKKIVLARCSVVLVLSFGGMGKTSLVRELIYRCANHLEEDRLKIDGAVWIRCNEENSRVKVNTILDEIAMTMGFEGLTELPNKDKQYQIDQLLRKKKIFLVIDGADVISNEEVFQWLLTIPEPSKCIVTSRDNITSIRRDAYVYELTGMSKEEALQFIALKLQQLNKESWGKNVSQLEKLIDFTGGNPKAIEVILGIMKHAHKTISETLRDLSSSKNELFENLFEYCWQSLDYDTKNILLTLSLFPYSASIEAITFVSSIELNILPDKLERLTDLSLVDVLRNDLDTPSRFVMHPLVKAFVMTKKHENMRIHEKQRKRWIDWYMNISDKIGFCWNDVEKLEILDQFGERETLQLVVDWAYKNGWYDDAIRISKNVRYYFYVRGFWATEPPINILRAKSAHAKSDFIEELDALVYHINIAAKQGNDYEIMQNMPRVEEIIATYNIPNDIFVDYQHAKALCLMHQGNLNDAEKLWQENLSSQELSTHAYNANRRWYAVCLYRNNKIEEAKVQFEDLLIDAKKHNFERGIVAVKLWLARIDIGSQFMNKAEKTLNEILQLAVKIQDKLAIADIYNCKGRINIANGDSSKAIINLTKAGDLYERLRVMEKLQTVREQIEALEKERNDD